MRPAALALAIISALAMAMLVLLRAEKLHVVALTAVQLYDPATVAGKIGEQPKILGVMSPGDRLPVVECFDRKSDIESALQNAHNPHEC